MNLIRKLSLEEAASEIVEGVLNNRNSNPEIRDYYEAAIGALRGATNTDEQTLAATARIVSVALRNPNTGIEMSSVREYIDACTEYSFEPRDLADRAKFSGMITIACAAMRNTHSQVLAVASLKSHLASARSILDALASRPEQPDHARYYSVFGAAVIASGRLAMSDPPDAGENTVRSAIEAAYEGIWDSMRRRDGGVPNGKIVGAARIAGAMLEEERVSDNSIASIPNLIERVFQEMG